MRFRQIHLDFHTSGDIPGIGESFDKKQFQQTLKNAHVDSITCFSSCHHGWSYHPTKVGKMHPNLDFDLLGAQIEACKEVDVNVPVYLTAGVNNVAADAHPEWREIGADGSYLGWTKSIFQAGFKNMCFNSPYLEYLCDMIAEVVDRYPNCDGIFLDIIFQSKCCCKYCLEVMGENGLDPANENDLALCADMALERYYRMTTETARKKNPDMPIFHNSGHVHKNRKDRLKYFSHLEMESLPTGGWGYDHFPISAKYAMNLNMDYLGMTGKFHTTWGEFGGCKHPNALLHEVQSMLAFGARCSVGDQAHPCVKLDESTYKLIGNAYQDVEKKEPWCVNAANAADIGVVCSEAVNKKGISAGRDVASDTGVSRLLLEGHYLFDLIDEDSELSRYKMLILPDEIELSAGLKSKIESFLDSGGKLLLTGSSGFDEAGEPMFNIGADCFGRSEYSPDYILPSEEVRCSYVNSPLVMYLPSRRIKVTTGKSLGVVYDPYFNRTARHFCSHQHTPYKPQPSGYDCGVINGSVMYLAHPVFSIYRGYGAAAYKEYAIRCIDMLLGDDKSLKTNMPSTARVSLMHQAEQRRYVLHLLYANKISRGGKMSMSGGNVQAAGREVEIIEELLPLADVSVTVSLAESVKSVKLEPAGKNIDAQIQGKTVTFNLNSFTSHAMIVMDY
ncbi:Beta-galactosidase trimerization domain protein [Limihaloglobus sulfuriphilus]|uniref:Beta-galactosidase trimerization domain protein n=1 Tax=Limihaloglobus sulfuriphilus TaxID=1851148 RepID=A0A1Q2MDA4_9BACT|nr:alpha-amylase family protein [Limihaloglobus sulfuriphilus]AQQ70297.1 Beta-galactosidase trimerization domain protein [Limihaloglobus sulfuriphilus]